jgi:hypothetical protein
VSTRALVLVLVAATLAPGRAQAQPVPSDAAPLDEAELQALVARGEQLAIDKDYAGAIEQWKQADRTAPRALHACLIGRAYSRRGLWAQAELFYAECRRRATAEHPAPGWLDVAERELAAQIERAGGAAVTIVVSPPAEGVQVKLSGFAPDEAFAPRTIHLPPGQHTISASAPGVAPVTETFDVDGPAARTITLELRRDEPEPVRPSRDVAPPRVRRGVLPWIVLGAGGALAVGGGIYHSTVLRGAYDDLEATDDRGFYDGEGDRAWRSARRNTIILYSAAAATIGAGVALRLLGVGDRRETPAVSLLPLDGGGVVTAGWGR